MFLKPDHNCSLVTVERELVLIVSVNIFTVFAKSLFIKLQIKSSEKSSEFRSLTPRGIFYEKGDKPRVKVWLYDLKPWSIKNEKKRGLEVFGLRFRSYFSKFVVFSLPSQVGKPAAFLNSTYGSC